MSDEEFGNLVLNESAVSSDDESVSVGAVSSAIADRWQLTAEFENKQCLKDFIQQYTHKMTASHGMQKSKCNKHAERHLQHYGYLRCSSVKCIKTPDDICTFVFKVCFVTFILLSFLRFKTSIQTVECLNDKTIRLYQNGSHLNKYDETDSRKFTGIHYFYKAEIDKLLADEAGNTPYAISKILTKRFNDKCPGYNHTLPTVPQIRNYKRTVNKGPNASYNNEYEQVSALINQLSYKPESSDETAFTYGVKMGTGADNDPLIICFTSKHLLKNISKYSDHYSVFHIDGNHNA